MRWNSQCSVGLCCIPRLRVADGAPDAAVFFSRRIRHFLNYVSELMSYTHSPYTHMHAHTHSSPCGDLRQTVYPLSPGPSHCLLYTPEREREREREQYMNCTVYSRTGRRCKNVCDYHCLSLIILIWKVYYHIICTPPVVYCMRTEWCAHLWKTLFLTFLTFISDWWTGCNYSYGFPWLVFLMFFFFFCAFFYNFFLPPKKCKKKKMYIQGGRSWGKNCVCVYPYKALITVLKCCLNTV